MHSPNSDVSAVSRGPGPGYSYIQPATAASVTTTTTTDTHCYCHLCAHDRPKPTAPGVPMPELRSGGRLSSRASPEEEEEEGVPVQEGPHARRSLPVQSRRRRESREERLERNGGVNGGGYFPPRNLSRKVDFYLGPDHCSVPGDTTPGFPREWDPCYSPPPRWNWPVVEPCREHCACTRDVWPSPEWERTPLPPPPPPLLPSPPCCYSPERRPSTCVSHVPSYLPSPEFRGYPRHREVLNGGMMGEPCWDCVRDRYWKEVHRPDLIAVDPVCGYSANGQRQRALSPAHEPTGRQHQLLSRQTSPEHGTFNGPTTPGSRTFFSTEVPPAKLRGPYDVEPGSCRAKSVVNGPLRRESKPESHKEREKEKKEKESTSGAVNQHQQDQGSVREQIRRVVGDLQEVLGGLKQVHLEMKEVVQQIDVLTSTIDLVEDEPGKQISHESVQQQTVRHEVKALVHRPADTQTITYQKPKHRQLQTQESQPLRVNGHATPPVPRLTPSPSPKPSTCHPSVTQRGHTATGDLSQVTALIPGHEAAKDQSQMNGTCVAPRPPRDRVKDAQRRRIELVSPCSLPTPNGNAASIKNHKPPPYPNHNGRVETLHKNSDGPVGALRTGAHARKGRQVSTAV